MRYLKKVSVSTLDTSGRIVDSLQTADNPHLNAPSIYAVKKENAAINADLKTLADDSYYSNGETIIFKGDGWNAGNAVICGLYYIKDAYFSITPRKKLKENQTVNIEFIENGTLINYRTGATQRLNNNSIPNTLSGIEAEAHADINQIQIKLHFVNGNFDYMGPCVLSGGGIRLTIRED